MTPSHANDLAQRKHMNIKQLIDFKTSSILLATDEYIAFYEKLAGFSPGCVKFKKSITTPGKVSLIEEGTSRYDLTTYPLDGDQTYSPNPSAITLNVIDALSGKKAQRFEWEWAIKQWIGADAAMKKIVKATSLFPRPKTHRPLVVSLTYYDAFLTKISYPSRPSAPYDGIFKIRNNDIRCLQEEILFHAAERFYKYYPLFLNKKFKVKVKV